MARLSLASLLVLVACEHGQTPLENVIVAPLREPCQGFGPVMCLSMTPFQRPMERVFFGIEGYNHRWGTESEITLRREPVVPPLPDGPSENLILIETIAENKIITAPFGLRFPAGGIGFFSGSGAVLDMLGTAVQCDPTVCSDILTAANQGISYEVQMELTGDDQTLRALAINQ